MGGGRRSKLEARRLVGVVSAVAFRAGLGVETGAKASSRVADGLNMGLIQGMSFARAIPFSSQGKPANYQISSWAASKHYCHSHGPLPRKGIYSMGPYCCGGTPEEIK